MSIVRADFILPSHPGGTIQIGGGLMMEWQPVPSDTVVRLTIYGALPITIPNSNCKYRKIGNVIELEVNYGNFEIDNAGATPYKYLDISFNGTILRNIDYHRFMNAEGYIKAFYYAPDSVTAEVTGTSFETVYDATGSHSLLVGPEYYKVYTVDTKTQPVTTNTKITAEPFDNTFPGLDPTKKNQVSVSVLARFNLLA